MVRKLVAVSCLVALLTSCAQVRREFTGDPVITEGTSVIVSTVDIPAGAAFNPLIKGGKFASIWVPNSATVPGAVVDISQLQGKFATAPIYQKEQIPLARVGDRCPDQKCM